MVAEIFWFNTLTGGGSAMDGKDGDDYADLDASLVITAGATPKEYIYILDADGSQTEDSPLYVNPDTNAGTKSHTLAETIRRSGTFYDGSPYLKLINVTDEDTDGGRESVIDFKGRQSGAEETTLARIRAQHDGGSDDEKGDLIFYTNDGSDTDTPTERLRIDSAGLASFTGDINLLDGKKLKIGTGNDGTIYSSSDDVYFENDTQDKDIIFKVNDGGVDTEVFRVDGSESSVAFNTKSITGVNSITATTFTDGTATLTSGDITGLTQAVVDDITIDGNAITSGGASSLTITPTAGQKLIVDGHWGFDGTAFTAETDANTTLTAYAGKNITIESVTFDGGVVAGASSITSTTLTDGTASINSGDITGATSLVVDNITIDGDSITDASAITISSSGAGVNITTHSDASDDFTVNTTALIVQGNTGNVGIGKTPSYKLEVGGAASAFIGNNTGYLLNIDANSHGIAVGEDSELGTSGFDGTAIVLRSGSGGSFGYVTNSGGTALPLGAAVTLFRIQGNDGETYIKGKTGVNTTSPQSLLDVRGAAGAAGILTLSTAETTVVDGDVLGQINFQAPSEASGTDAILVGASIWAEADDTFAADNNTTDLVFATATSETATEKMRLDNAGNLGLGVSAFGTNATNVLGITADGTVPASSPSGMIQIYADDSSDGATNATLALRTEQAVEVIGTFTASHKLKIWINGVEYWIQLDAV